MPDDLTAAASLTAILALAATAATAAVPEPPINGVVVEDVTRSYSFDQVRNDFFGGGRHIIKDAYQGTVQSKVIRAPDNTLDFYFHFTGSGGALGDFVYQWQAPTSYTVAYHLTDPELQFVGGTLAGPAPGFSQTASRQVRATWIPEANNGAGVLHEGVLVLDTDARAYAATASYRLSDAASFQSGNWHGSSPLFTTFGPAAIPEPETYALMLCGLGLLALVRRRHRRNDKQPR